MYLKWGMLPDFGWSLIILIPAFLISLWVARKVSKRIIWLLPALVLYSFVGWEFSEPYKILFKVLFWLIVLAVIATTVLTAIGRYERTRGSKAPLLLMVMMLGILLVSGLLGTQADELRNFSWNVELVLALIFGVVGLILYFLLRPLGFLALVIAAVFLFAGIGGASLQTDEMEPTGRPSDSDVDVCLVVDGKVDRGPGKIQEKMPPGWSHVKPTETDCVTEE